MSEENDSRIQVEITDLSEPHCFRLVFNPLSGERIEIMLHARSLVDLIHQCSAALCEWQHQTTDYLIDRIKTMAEIDTGARIWTP